MYSTGNHIADGDYSSHVEAMEAHWREVEREEFERVYASEKAEEEQFIHDSGIDELRDYYTDMAKRCTGGAKEAYHQLIDELNVQS